MEYTAPHNGARGAGGNRWVLLGRAEGAQHILPP